MYHSAVSWWPLNFLFYICLMLLFLRAEFGARQTAAPGVRPSKCPRTTRSICRLTLVRLRSWPLSRLKVVLATDRWVSGEVTPASNCFFARKTRNWFLCDVPLCVQQKLICILTRWTKHRYAPYLAEDNRKSVENEIFKTLSRTILSLTSALNILSGVMLRYTGYTVYSND